MRFRKAVALSCILTGLAGAAETKNPAAPPPATEQLNQREIALDKLLTERDSPEKLAAVIEEARKQGISEQAVLEAKFIFHVDREEDEAIAALLPDFEKQAENFKLSDSEIFATREDWLAVIEYVKAIKALRGGDKAAFKTHITEAFWLSPKQGTAFAPHIERMRMAETMAAVKVDFQDSFKSLTGGDALTLSKVIGDKKALLLHFWSPWSAECEAFLPDIAAIALSMEKSPVAVASIVMEDSAKSVSDARDMLKPYDPALPGAWLIDHESSPLSPMLRIQNVPQLVLLTAGGEVLYNGPADGAELWNELRKIDPSITKPKLGQTEEGQ